MKRRWLKFSSHREHPLMTSDVFWPFLTKLTTLSNNFYLIMSDIWRLFCTPLPTLKSDSFMDVPIGIFPHLQLRRSQEEIPSLLLTLASTIHKYSLRENSHMYVVRFLGRQVSQVASDFTKQASVVKHLIRVGRSKISKNI